RGPSRTPGLEHEPAARLTATRPRPRRASTLAGGLRETVDCFDAELNTTLGHTGYWSPREASLRGRPVRRRGQKSRVPAGVHRTRKGSRFTGRLVSPTDKENERRAARNQAY